MARAKTDSTRIDDAASKAPSDWLVLDDLFQQWSGRLESSREAEGELWDFLRDPDTRSAYVSAGVPPPGWVSWLPPGPASLVVLSYFYAGELSLWGYEFWRDTAHPEVVPDVDGVGDRLEVHRPIYVHGDGPFSPGGTFLVRRLDAERRERLYPWLAAPPPAPSKEQTSTSAPKKKRRKAKQASRAGAPEQHDWEEGELFAMQELTTRGNPLDKNNQTKGWKTISDLARLVRNHLKDLSKDKDYVGPDMSTARGKAADFIKKFERERN